MDGAFDLGRWQESTRTRERVRRHVLERDGRTTVFVRVGSDLGGDTTLVGLSVPLERVAAHVRIENDVPAIDAGASVTASCDAVPAGKRPPREVARGLPVSVEVTLDGYQPVEFEWRLDRAPTILRMKPAP